MARKSAVLLAALATLSSIPSQALAQQEAQDNDATQQPLPAPYSGLPDNYECTHPPYKTHIVSKSPSVIYLSGFLTPFERLHLQEITKDSFSHSRVLSQQIPNPNPQTNHTGVQHEVRTSQSTTAPHDDPVVLCILSRSQQFQSLSLPRSHLEPLQLVKYGPGQHYHFHTDWFTSPAHTLASAGGNRVSSIFAYVKAEGVTGGGTNFPLLDAPSEGAEGTEEWCGILDCDEEWEKGVTFRALEGNAVYWENMGNGGRGDQRTLHAGLPVVKGEKIGMNIWTREGALSEEVRGAVGGD